MVVARGRLEELAKRPTVSSIEASCAGETGWISYLDPPRVFHLYLFSEPDRIRYEFFRGMEEKVSGLMTYGTAREAVRLYFGGDQIVRYLKSQSTELYEEQNTGGLK